MRYRVTYVRNGRVRRSMPLECSGPDKAMKLYMDILESAGVPARSLKFADWFVNYEPSKDEGKENILDGIPEHDL